jgi:hypothetical protein
MRLRLLVALLMAVSAHATITINYNATALGANGGTTTALNCSGMSAEFVIVQSYSSGPAPTVKDLQGNTLTALHLEAGSSNGNESQIWYASNTSQTSSQTFTVSGTGIYGSAFEACAVGNASSFGFSTQNYGSQASGISYQCCSVTPPSGESLVIGGVSTGTNSQTSFTLSDSTLSYTVMNTITQSNGAYFGGVDAYAISESATATNPTWTANSGSGGPYWTGVIAVFTIPAASAPSVTSAGPKIQKLIKLGAIE